MSESPLLFVHFVSTLVMIGIIWFVQVVHYPLMANVGVEQFRSYSQLHQSRTSLVVLGPMLIEATSALWLFISSSELRRSPIFLLALLLLGLIWASTFFWQVPLHKALSEGYDARRIRRLTHSNWLRTVAWTIRGVLLVTLEVGRTFEN